MYFPDAQSIKELPIQDLAYVGDSVYELYMRQRCLLKYKVKPSKLHGIVIKYVNAKYQAEAAKVISEYLTEEEKNILKRGRNANPGTKAKNASIEDYRLASGLETLIGYVYLHQNFSRLEELMDMIFIKDELNERE